MINSSHLPPAPHMNVKKNFLPISKSPPPARKKRQKKLSGGGGGRDERLKLFIGLAFHTIFVIFLSAQTYLIIIIFLYVYSPPFLPITLPRIYSSVLLKFPRKTSSERVPLNKVVADKFRRKTFLKYIQSNISISLRLPNSFAGVYGSYRAQQCAWMCVAVIESNESTDWQEANVNFWVCCGWREDDGWWIDGSGREASVG
jgi:hypothetical protein